MSTAVKVIQAPIEFGNTVKNSTDLFDKGCKVTNYSVKTIDATANLISGATSAWGPLTALAKSLSGFCSVVSAFNLINRLFEFLLPGKNGDFSWKFWKKNKVKPLKYEWMDKSWQPDGSKLSKDKLDELKKKASANRLQDDGYWTWMKTASQTGLTFCHAIDFVSFFNAIGAIALGTAGAVLTTVKNVVYLPVAMLNIADSGYQIRMADRYVSNCTDKVKKWAELRAKGADEVKAHFDDKITATAAKVDALKEKLALDNVGEPEKNAIRAFVEHKERKIARWDQYKAECDSDDFANTEGNGQLQFFKDCTIKIQEWGKNATIAKSNASKTKTKSWLNIANQVGKFALGLICLVGLATGVAFNPIFVLVISIGWLATHVFGFSKAVYSVYNPTQKLQRPKLNYAATAA
ncbi:MAG: hypothetical protein VX777_06395 [Chlamydiota bacterium]|nr:hypothetical protein [Chlamydiota bacterium]